MKTGIIGGTFDPIHNAHLMIANKAYSEFHLDRVLFMPSPNPPHKNEDEITPISMRINMIKLAIEDYPYFEFSDYELNRTGKVYSADTLTAYKKENPDEELYFIIGSDSLYTIDSWYHPEIIFKTSHILAAKRDDASGSSLEQKVDFLKKNYNADISILHVNASDISSTKIRQSISQKDVSESIPQKVIDYIKANTLYKDYQSVCRMTNAEIIEDLKKSQNPHRFAHTLGVADTAKQMAEVLGENPNNAYLAGLLHDNAKCFTDEEQIQICKKNNIEISCSEQQSPYLLHAKTGAFFAETKYGITNKNIISAIKYHTTGRKNMSLLEKIIFTADYIEPGRNKQPNLDILRETAYTDIDATVYLILKDTLEYLRNKSRDSIDEQTYEAYMYYKNVIENRNK